MGPWARPQLAKSHETKQKIMRSHEHHNHDLKRVYEMSFPHWSPVPVGDGTRGPSLSRLTSQSCTPPVNSAAGDGRGST